MAGRGGIDLWASRRDRFEECRWWKRKEGSTIPPSDVVREASPSGYFFAREENPISARDDRMGSGFWIPGTDVTLSTGDDVGDLDHQDAVEYAGSVWNVVGVQRKKVIKSSQSSREPRYETYVSLRK